jgi:hypothetical protein
MAFWTTAEQLPEGAEYEEGCWYCAHGFNLTIGEDCPRCNPPRDTDEADGFADLGRFVGDSLVAVFIFGATIFAMRVLA